MRDCRVFLSIPSRILALSQGILRIDEQNSVYLRSLLYKFRMVEALQPIRKDLSLSENETLTCFESHLPAQILIEFVQKIDNSAKHTYKQTQVSVQPYKTGPKIRSLYVSIQFLASVGARFILIITVDFLLNHYSMPSALSNGHAPSKVKRHPSRLEILLNVPSA